MAITEVTLNGVSAKVLADGYAKGNAWERGPWRRIRYLCEYDKSDTFIDALMGVPGTPINGVTYPTPHAYPGNPIIKCMEAEMIDWAGPARPDIHADDEIVDKLWACDLAFVEALYETPRYPISASDDPAGNFSFSGNPSPFRTVAQRYGFRTYRVPKTALVMPDGSAPPDGIDDLVISMPQTEYVFRYEMYPNIPHALFRQLSGKVNDPEFWGCGIGTLLFTGGSAQPQRSPTGAWLTSAEFSLTWQEVDHNCQVDPQTGEFIIVYRRADGVTPRPAHEYADFSILS